MAEQRDAFGLHRAAPHAAGRFLVNYVESGCGFLFGCRGAVLISECFEICCVRIPSVSFADSVPTPFGPSGHFPLTGGISPLCPRGALGRTDPLPVKKCAVPFPLEQAAPVLYDRFIVLSIQLHPCRKNYGVKTAILLTCDPGDRIFYDLPRPRPTFSWSPTMAPFRANGTCRFRSRPLAHSSGRMA